MDFISWICARLPAWKFLVFRPAGGRNPFQPIPSLPTPFSPQKQSPLRDGEWCLAKTPCRRLTFALSTTLGLLVCAHPSQADTQTLSLSAGWNLIAFQVLPPDPSPATVFGSLGSAFDRVFTYDSSVGGWASYGAASASTDPSVLQPLSPVIPGRGYWIYMKQAVPAWTVTGTTPSSTPPVNFNPGWNLIGVPVGSPTLSEKVDLLAVLTASGLNFTEVLRWEQSLYTKFDPSGSLVDDFTTLDANRGYWVHVKGTNSFALQPQLLAAVRADQDVAPYGNYPSYEDVVISDSAVPLNATNQNVIRFLPGEESALLALSNVGGGILLWDLSVTNAPWLRLSAQQGVTTLENDVIELTLDRKLMLPGHYETQLYLRTTVGNRVWKIVADVAPLAGDWRGSAIITSVNGRHNAVPDIDLHISFFEDTSTPGLLRGLIDSQNALLWPADVSLIGHRDDNNNYSFGGGLVLAPGDVNQAPYQQFNPSGEDVDWNCNGILDALNPYPFPVYRQITLSGALTEANTADGFTLVGDYSETVYGMLKQPIQLRGQFTLRRENPVPYSSRRSQANAESALGTDPVVIKQIATRRTINSGTTSIPIAVGTDLELGGLIVGLDLSGISPTNAQIFLQPPSGKPLVLHDRGAIATLVGLSFPDLQKPKDDFGSYLAQSQPTRGTWKLVINNVGSSPGSLANVSLKLWGQPVFSVVGTVQTIWDGNTNASGLPAQVSLDGLPYNAATLADTNGNFQFSRIPGIPLNLSASLAGFGPANPASPGLSQAFTLPQYNTNCLSPFGLTLAGRFQPLPVSPIPSRSVDGFVSGPGQTNAYTLQMKLVGSPSVDRVGLIATPFIGPAPMPVDFAVITENAYDGQFPLLYHFGDGSPEVVLHTIYPTHTYLFPSTNGYTADLTIRIEGSPDFRLPTSVFPMPSPGHSPYSFNFFSVAFTGGGSLPPSIGATITGTNDLTAPPALVGLLQVQLAYSASFDLNLAPSIAVGARFDSDGFDPHGTVSDPANWLGNFRGIKYAYAVEDGQGPGAWSNSAQCGDVIPLDNYRGYPHLGSTGPCAAPKFSMTCNIGAVILPSTADQVYAIDPAQGPIYPDSPDPLSAVSASGIGKSGSLRLVGGPLAGFWIGGNN